jgi:uncharacterized LabA/DUF88 family protein
VLRAAVIIDYQNMQTTGMSRFNPQARRRDYLLDPVKFSEVLIELRNSRVPEPGLLAKLERIEIYRGLPSSVHDPSDHATNLEQMNRWMRDSRVKVTHRNLKYDFSPSLDANGNPRRFRSKMEKGIDVLCALAIMRNSSSPEIDLVIVASHDSDLEPAIEEAQCQANGTKIETVSWFNPEFKNTRSKMNPKTPNPIWNTALRRESYLASIESKQAWWN